MTCKGCVTKAKSELLKIGDVTEAEVQLQSPQAKISMQRHIPVTALQSALSKAGQFTITEIDGGMNHPINKEDGNTESWLKVYKPIFIIGAFISGITLLIEFSLNNFAWERWMQHFMAAFFIVFSFFKLLDIKGFAESYATYDIIARKWQGWGYVYTFTELALGIAYLLKFNPLLTNGVTFAVMSISLAGVVQSVLNKRKIQCACLGSVFKLPMSTITIVEDAVMIGMSAFMILKSV